MQFFRKHLLHFEIIVLLFLVTACIVAVYIAFLDLSVFAGSYNLSNIYLYVLVPHILFLLMFESNIILLIAATITIHSILLVMPLYGLKTLHSKKWHRKIHIVAIIIIIIHPLTLLVLVNALNVGFDKLGV